MGEIPFFGLSGARFYFLHRAGLFTGGRSDLHMSSTAAMLQPVAPGAKDSTRPATFVIVLTVEKPGNKAKNAAPSSRNTQKPPHKHPQVRCPRSLPEEILT